MRSWHQNSMLRSAVVVCAFLGLVWVPQAFGQEEAEGVSEPAVEAEQPERPAPGPRMWPERPEKIPLNLKRASIDNVIDFLRIHTGKTVVKSKDVRAEITIATPEPVSPQTAVRLIIDALRIEGVAVVERDDVLQIIPVAKLAEMGIETRAISLKFADAAQMEKLIRPLLAEGVKLVADSWSAQILLTGPAQELAEVEKLVRQLDVLEIEGTQVQIFQLKYAEATEIAAVLEVILRDGATQAGRPQEGKQPPKPGAPSAAAARARDDVAIVAYPTANWLVVRAPKNKLEAAEQLIAQLDKEKPPELIPNVILVEHADAAELARQLSQLFRRKPGTRSVRDTIELAADQRSNALIVYSTDENFELVEKVMAELDTEESRRTETRSYELTYADAEDVAEQLNELYTGLGDRSPSYGFFYYPRRQRETTTTRFVPERRTNTLIVIAQPAEFDQIEDLIAKLDQPISKTEVSPRIYHIRNMGATEMTDVLNQIFGIEEEQRTGGYYYYLYRSRSGEQEVGRLYGKVRFVHEPTTNSVIVITNNKENYPIIEDLIEALDRPAPEYANTIVYVLDNADATELADQLNSLFAPPGAARPAGERADEEAARTAYYSWLYGTARRGAEEESPISNLIGKVRVVPDPRTNSLLITTAVQHVEVIRQLIKQLDIESPKVLIKVRLVEVTQTRESRIGTRFSSDASIFDSKDFNNGLLSTFGFTWDEVSHDTVVSGDVNLSLLIQFLQREFDARVLSQPSLVVNNNKEATIFVGSEIPWIKESQGEPGTIARNIIYDYRQVGTRLVIRPHINQLGKVVTTVQITADQIREGEVLFGAPLLDSRSYDTELAVEGEQTIVIGGILRQEEAEIIHRVPILGHIPVLNLLFSKKDTSHTTTELIAFITPIVLTSRADDDRATQEERDSLQGLQEWLLPGGEGGGT